MTSQELQRAKRSLFRSVADSEMAVNTCHLFFLINVFVFVVLY